MGVASVIFASQPGAASDAEPYADLVKRGVAARLWLGQSLRAETHQVVAHLAGGGHQVPTGTSVTLMPLRHPLQAALEARSLASMTGHPVVAGFGASAPEFVSVLNGTPYRRPAAMAREYLSTVRALLDGRGLRGFTLPPLRHPPVELGAGVLRPGMARVAGECADVAITWMTPPSYVRDVLLPALSEGAGDVRAVPRVATVVHVALSRPGRDATRLAELAAGHHLRAAHYADMLRRAGLEASPRAMVDGGLFVTGTARRVADQLHEYFLAGVDEIILNTTGVLLAEGGPAAIGEAEEILTALGESP
ncbi:LLM class flavin-dependent oxidoreductase [Nonomuraea jiangxiensis]|uniref:Flavin-dependent oxidoreductase, luciferase family (Includes alkanesulfonate monooxygenase SsuD and methylene tetrahydromethanopterin reductase) n=1 Tax=Nonomuraea jiangxiensis TaxID=633440 RepID=A0A1G9CP84_9ACTN|nr:LLM class flavin-dependent oxidoreductase [Nonomuraea jiangxiensis]SDK53472.1 Flavin-dependent oxidoreductase, luciferase family (includes alkanesulfonate monooxygenase SsuD and methylene tetrahydromethanopterin reductase) [Nonomuraea jiangxiensis]